MKGGLVGSSAGVLGSAALVAWLYMMSAFGGDSIKIELKHNDERELETKAQLERLVSGYDLRKYTFTREVVIDENAIPHSHPVLTLHTRHLHQDDELLSTYVHEQLHWYLVDHRRQTESAEAELRKVYPKVPVGYPEGADSEESTYLHLIDCYLEMQADRQLMGAKRAAKVMNFWAGDHYRWVYRTVMKDESVIHRIVVEHQLEIN